MKTGKRPFLVGQCLRDTWDLYCRHFVFILSLYLLGGFPIGALVTATGWCAPEARVTDLLMVPWLAASIWGVQQRESGWSGRVRQSLWQGLKLTPQLLWFQIISGLCLILSALCFILPAIYVWVSLSIGAALISGFNRSVDSAVTESFILTKSHFWKMLLFWLALIATLALVAVGNMSVLETLQYTGMVRETQIAGWPTKLFELFLHAQLLVGSHLAGLAALKQLMISPECVEEPDLGFIPAEAEE